MPSERNSSPNTERSPPEPQSNNKVCSNCQLPLDAASVTALFIVCGGCRDKAVAPRDVVLLPNEPHTLCLERETDVARTHTLQEEAVTSLRPTRQVSDERVLDHDTDMDTPSSLHTAPPPSDSPYRPPAITAVDIARPTSSRQSSPFGSDQPLPNILLHTPSEPITTTRRTGYSSAFSLDPLADVTRLRVRTQTKCCLYPGASFQGTQKSGRNSYEVKVTIVVRISVCHGCSSYSGLIFFVPRMSICRHRFFAVTSVFEG
jgi:glucose-induced degradation protein 4